MSKDKFEWTDENVKQFAIKVFGEWDDHAMDDILSRFKASKQPKEPERTELSFIGSYRNASAIGLAFTHAFTTNKLVPEEKFPAIKVAIEQILNDDGSVGYFMGVYSPDGCKLKSKSEWEKDLEDAFNAGRMYEVRRPDVPVYFQFKDYLNQLKSK